MFIRQTKTGTASDGSDHITFRLVENRREGDRVRQRTLLNLGRHFAIGRAHWPRLCRRITDQLTGQATLDLSDPDPGIEVEARRLSALLIERGKDGDGDGARTKRDWQSVDVNSVTDSDGRSIGVEHAGLEALSSLGLPALFDGPFARRQQGAHDEYEHETPGRGGERIPEWFGPHLEDIRNRIARGGWILFRLSCFRVH